MVQAKSDADSGHLQLRISLAACTEVMLRHCLDTIPRLVQLMLSTEVLTPSFRLATFNTIISLCACVN